MQEYIKRIIYHDQRGFVPGMQGFFSICKSINEIHNINKLKKSHMTISVDAEKASYKIQDICMIKTLQNLGREETYFNIIKMPSKNYWSSSMNLQNIQKFISFLCTNKLSEKEIKELSLLQLHQKE